MKRAFSTGAGLAGLVLSLLVLWGVLFPAHAAPADAKALQAAHTAYFASFPQDRTAVLALGQQGNPFASMMLERTWQRPSYGPVSESDARHWRDRAVAADVHSRLRALADANDAIAMTWLGSAYRHGLLGLAEDVPQSASWYARAAEKGNAVAQWLYAGMLINGDGVAKDEAAGNAWYLKAATQGHRLAQAALGYSYEAGRGVAKDPAQALAWYQKAADQGDAEAQTMVARAYWEGSGVPQDDVQAVSWYRKAANQGYVDAQVNLGHAYASGRGVPKDESQAMAWNRKAAEQGNAIAQANMGYGYQHGLGVPRDDTQALLWLRKAADQGNAGALAQIGRYAYDTSNYCAMIDAWEAAAPRMPTGTTHRNLAWQYHDLGSLALARDHAQRAIAKGGLDEDNTARLAKLIEETGRLEYVDPASLSWSGELRATRYQAMFDALSDKAFVTSGVIGDYPYSGYTSYLSCGPGKDLLVQIGSGKGSRMTSMLYRYDSALGIYRAFPRPWTSGVVGENELTIGPQGQLVSRGVEADRKGRRRALEPGRSEVAVMPDGRVRQSRDSIYTSKMDHTYATLIPRQDAADAANAALRDVQARQAQVQVQRQEEQEKANSGELFRSLVGAAVVGGMASAGGLDGDQVMGAALKGAQIFNPDSAAAATLGSAGDQMLGTGGTTGGLASAASAVSWGGSYATRPNLATGACAGFTESNYRQKAVSGGGDQQLYTMCGQAFEYYTMYKRAIAQGYSEADANRTYAAHQQAAQVAQGYLQSHGAN